MVRHHLLQSSLRAGEAAGLLPLGSDPPPDTAGGSLLDRCPGQGSGSHLALQAVLSYLSRFCVSKHACAPVCAHGQLAGVRVHAWDWCDCMSTLALRVRPPASSGSRPLQLPSARGGLLSSPSRTLRHPA